MSSTIEKDTVNVKFKSRKQKIKILIDRKNLQNNSEKLFVDKLFISENMYHENHQLAYKCKQLKNAGKIYSA